VTFDPCAGHSCDHCDICEGRTPEGVPRCCGSVGSSASVSVPDPVSALRQAIEEDASERLSLQDLMRLDAVARVLDSVEDVATELEVRSVNNQLHGVPLALPPHTETLHINPSTKAKEAVRVRKTT